VLYHRVTYDMAAGVVILCFELLAIVEIRRYYPCPGISNKRKYKIVFEFYLLRVLFNRVVSVTLPVKIVHKTLTEKHFLYCCARGLWDMNKYAIVVKRKHGKILPSGFFVTRIFSWGSFLAYSQHVFLHPLWRSTNSFL